MKKGVENSAKETKNWASPVPGSADLGVFSEVPPRTAKILPKSQIFTRPHELTDRRSPSPLSCPLTKMTPTNDFSVSLSLYISITGPHPFQIEAPPTSETLTLSQPRPEGIWSNLWAQETPPLRTFSKIRSNLGSRPHVEGGGMGSESFRWNKKKSSNF